MSKLHRLLLVGVMVLLAFTLSAMIALWPGPDELAGLGASEPLDALVAGEVVRVETRQDVENPDLGLSGEVASLSVRALDGPDAGDVLELEINTDGYPAIEVGDRVALDRTTGPDGDLQYFLTDFQRLPTLAWLVGLFVVAVLAISRWHGLRSLVGLAASLLIIVQFVVPAILAGRHPPTVALVAAVAIMIVTLYLTHGVNEMTTAAVAGTTVSLGLTVLLGSFVIENGKITGFASGDAVFARSAVAGLDLQGLVLAGLIIAALGVLDDVTVSQSSTVFALHETDPTLTWSSLFARAMQVGRDHIASVVNTLFLAYAGASIALLLLFSTGGVPVTELLNSEVLAEEIIKTVVGSLGLILAVPLTTALAVSIVLAGSGPPPAAAAGRGARNPSPAPEAPEPDDAGEVDEEERSRRAWAAYLARQEGVRTDTETGAGGGRGNGDEVNGGEAN